MSYLVLGSNSFAGGSLVDYLLTRGSSVIGISRSKQVSPILQPYYANPNINNLKFMQLDLNNDFSDLVAIISQFKPKYIIDLAGQGMVAESWNQPEQWYTTNIISKVKLHDFLRTCDFIEKYVRVSTPEVYGSTNGCVDEKQRFSPSTPYAVSHAAIDMSLLAFYQQYNFPVILTRFANFYGAHQQLYRIIPRTVIYALLGKTLSLHGGGTATRAFIHGYDVATAIVRVIEAGDIGETYHFSSEEPISIKDLVVKICTLMDVNVDSFVQISPDRPGKDAHYNMDMTKARNKLNWSPVYSLDKGVSEVIEWVKYNIEEIKTLPLNYIHQA